MRATCCLLFGPFAIFLAAGSPARADTSTAEATKYTLRYKFHPGETLRWDVTHRTKVRTSVSGSTEGTETVSKSVKIWRVGEVKPDGTATFEHSVENVEMSQEFSTGERASYDSTQDKTPPVGFENVSEAVGVTLSVVTMDACGKIIERKRKQVKASPSSEGPMTIPLPEEPVGVGHSWSFPHEIEVPLNTGAIKKVKARQLFTLVSVKTGVATIEVTTQILTPIHDPAVEALLIQRESAGRVRLDVDAGRILSQQMDVDKRVVGFRGGASSLHYLTRFTEKLLPSAPRTASR